MNTNEEKPAPYDANQYQLDAHEFASYGGNQLYPVLGLAEEAGEACGKIAKYIRKHDGITPKDGKGWTSFAEDNHQLICDAKKELGDVLWMVAEIATNFGLTLGDIMSANLLKLEDRKARGVIVGEGDNR